MMMVSRSEFLKPTKSGCILEGKQETFLMQPANATVLTNKSKMHCLIRIIFQGALLQLTAEAIFSLLEKNTNFDFFENMLSVNRNIILMRFLLMIAVFRCITL
jgi:hypothetical protein